MGMKDPDLAEAVEQIADLQSERIMLKQAIRYYQDREVALETELEEVVFDRDAYADEAYYVRGALELEESHHADFRTAIVEELEMLANVPLSKLVESINEVIRYVEDDGA